MNMRLEILAAVLLALPFASVDAAAQTLDPIRSATPEMLCDYCDDYTDAATLAGTARSAYRPGIGYAAKSESALTGATPQRQDLARLLALSKRMRGESR